MNNRHKSIRLAIIATGIGVIRRGFEVSAVNWYQALEEDGRVNVCLYGARAEAGAQAVPCLRQNGWTARILRKLRMIKDGARLQQRTFFWGYLPVLLVWRPHFIWIQEWTLASQLQIWVRRLGLNTKIIFCDGAPVGAKACAGFDHIVLLHEAAYRAMLSYGAPSEKVSLIPYICEVKAVAMDRHAARAQLGYTDSDWVVLSVAAWNTHHKRIDYLIKEAAEANVPNLRLLLCGQSEKETEKLKELADKLMPNRVQWVTLHPDKVGLVYRAADVFTLASVSEGLGAVLIEAAYHNLPIICHQYDSARFIFGDYKGVADLSVPGGLQNQLERVASGVHWAPTRGFLENRLTKEILVKDMVVLLEGLS